MTAGISYGSPQGAGSLGDASATGRSSPRITGEMKPWTPDDDEALRALWADGHSSAEIGRRLGRTKNSIVGRAHRENLPARESPIIRDGRAPRDGRPAYVRPPRITLPPLASQIAEPAVVQFALPLAVLKPRGQPWPGLAPVVALPVAKPVQAPRPFARVGECQWTDSDCAPWLWCAEPTANGGSWCVAHHKRVFINRRSFMEAAD